MGDPDETVTSTTPLTLTPDQEEKLQEQQCVTEFKQNVLKKDAAKNWDKFYHRNTTNFFKDRHWTQREFQELCPEIDWESLAEPTPRNKDDREKMEVFNFLEAGCGVGNLLFPLAENYPGISVHGLDFSPRSINFITQDTRFDSNRMDVRVFDLTKTTCVSSESESLATASDPEIRPAETLPSIWAGKMNLITAVFVLSAIPPEKMAAAVTNLATMLAPKGVLIFRDYAISDHAMVRFGPRGSKIAEQFYARQDGTMAYFFSLEEVREMFEGIAGGLVCKSLNYVYRVTTNKKEGVSVSRCFLQGKFVKH